MNIFLLIFLPVLIFSFSCLAWEKLLLKDTYEIKDISNENYDYLIRQAMKDMDGREFELFIAEMFLRLGSKVEVTPATRDKGIDLIVDEIGIECKCYNKASISSPIVLKLMGALQLRGLSKGIIITTSQYTKDAIETCPTSIQRWYTEDIINTCLNIEDRIGFISYLGYDVKELEIKGIINVY